MSSITLQAAEPWEQMLAFFTALSAASQSGQLQRVPAKVIFMPKHGIRSRYYDVVWKVLFDEVQAAASVVASRGNCFGPTLIATCWTCCFSVMAFLCQGWDDAVRLFVPLATAAYPRGDIPTSKLRHLSTTLPDCICGSI